MQCTSCASSVPIAGNSQIKAVVLSIHVFGSKWFKQIMTLEEQIRVIELKGLSGEDERQVYTKLVCISLEKRNDELSRRTSLCDVTNLFSFDSNSEPLSILNGVGYNYPCNSEQIVRR